MFSTIVVGTDGSNTARHAVERAADLARCTGGRLHIVTAYKLASTAMYAAHTVGVVLPSGASDAEIAAGVGQELEALAKDLRSDGLEVETHACPGAAADALLEVAEAVKADVIVVGNRGMQGARRYLGSVPNGVSHHAHCAVLIVPTC